jgi:hypothetical protein
MVRFKFKIFSPASAMAQHWKSRHVFYPRQGNHFRLIKYTEVRLLLIWIK